jgi:prepilin-type N-terminal cleavage/methylation domain-containing protein
MKNYGFTLLETIIYIALFGVLMSGALLTVYELLGSTTSNARAAAILMEGTFVNRKLSWALTGAVAVSSLDPFTLSITRPDLGSASPLVFSQVASDLRFSLGTSAAVSILADEFAITNWQMVVTTMPSGQQVQIKYTLDAVPFSYETYVPNY